MSVKKCPFCFKDIQGYAVKCKYCGKALRKSINYSPLTWIFFPLLFATFYAAIYYSEHIAKHNPFDGILRDNFLWISFIAGLICRVLLNMCVSFSANKKILNKQLSGGISVLMLVGVCVFIGWQSCGGRSSPAGQIKAVGSQGRLYIDGSGNVIIAIDESALDEVSKARIAHDIQGLIELEQARRIFTVPENTKVLVIDKGFIGKTKIRIISEGRFSGITGWVYTEWVK